MGLMNSQTTKKVTLALGVASVAASMGNVAVKAGPALQTLNNMTNTAEFTINNTYGQSFSVDGIVADDLTPFANAVTALVNFTAGTATLTTGFVGNMFGVGVPTATNAIFRSVSQVRASVSVPAPSGSGFITFNTAVADITLLATTGTQTVGASISSTIFGPSTVKATSSFTNQLINDLSAF
jgi:hypothetical protein